MLSTIYIILSIVSFAFDTYPMYRHSKEQPEYQRMQIPKGMRKLDSIMYHVSKINLFVCAGLFVLKCIGIIEWW